MTALLLALGLSPPKPPEPRAAVDGECGAAWDVAEPCAATCVPTSEALEALDVADYARELEGYARALEMEVRALTRERDAALADAERWESEATRPVPVHQRPVFGVVAGVGLCAASGWALGQVDR